MQNSKSRFATKWFLFTYNYPAPVKSSYTLTRMYSAKQVRWNGSPYPTQRGSHLPAVQGKEIAQGGTILLNYCYAFCSNLTITVDWLLMNQIMEPCTSDQKTWVSGQHWYCPDKMTSWWHTLPEQKARQLKLAWYIPPSTTSLCVSDNFVSRSITYTKCKTVQ